MVWAAFAVGAFALAGCGPSAPAVTPEQLAGYWMRESEFGNKYVILFNTDGTFAATHSLEWFEQEDLIEQRGSFIIDGATLTFDTSPESVQCGGIAGIYELLVTEDGWMELTLVDDGCAFRESFYPPIPWQPVSP